MLFLSSNALHFGLCSVDLQPKSITSCIDFVHYLLQIIITLCRQMSSAKRRLDIQNPDTLAPNSLFCSARAITTSSSILNSSGDSTQPCITPEIVINHSDKSQSTRTALMVSLYSASNSFQQHEFVVSWRHTHTGKFIFCPCIALDRQLM